MAIHPRTECLSLQLIGQAEENSFIVITTS